MAPTAVESSCRLTARLRRVRVRRRTLAPTSPPTSASSIRHTCENRPRVVSGCLVILEAALSSPIRTTRSMRTAASVKHTGDGAECLAVARGRPSGRRVKAGRWATSWPGCSRLTSAATPGTTRTCIRRSTMLPGGTAGISSEGSQGPRTSSSRSASNGMTK
eukprot:1707424-Pyramimonas_sp.AAC.1